MIQWINKKRNQKGFTLIELIVVIAILGILAAIAIPRLGGFTDRAKEAADEQLGSIIKNSLAVEVASGNIGIETAGTDGVVTLTKSTGAYTLSGLEDKGGATLTVGDLKTMMDALVGDVATGADDAMQYYATLVFTIDEGTNEVTFEAN